MDQDKQKQITGYFIEEAKEHLQTIESGLLNLQSLMGNSEAVNEIFRAAHSIKGGAAMLGFSSIQHVAHNFEDYFKVMRENTNFQVDQDLQTLFLQAFDKLQELVEHLQSPYGLTKDAVDTVMAGSDQIFANLKNHLQNLIAGNDTEATMVVADPKIDIRGMLSAFQSEVPLKLRNMLELFKQPDSPRSRQNLAAICMQLQQIGDRFGLVPWSMLMESVNIAVTNPNNQFRTLAPILIKEIKQSQEQVLAQKADQIKASPQLLQLLPANVTSKSSPPKTAPSQTTKAANIASENTSADEVSKIFGAVIEEDKAMKGWQVFSDCVGWRQNGTWIASNASSTQTAPEGHFPTPLWLASWHQSKDSKAKEFQAQYAALLAKIASCNIN
ncbi:MULTISPECIES: Hpt domain-containing protein [Pseudanabaena]|jgi:chemotaxis protein histidine kinase CheA|uniref:Hpt domain-containing protein n=1 Tax=Pseudanabaena TaxID=1152 RepID=UPI0024787CC1|nr:MULTISPECIES: Hpt domain-containing protein [Pseudanabaena]MEA5487247.1 Hpt domain-containing protein [Pseudanabaena sp. CCNP1317]WGS70466.1 Hpt domain-containing protein [Pseudanabaena galeata CCNP1313]